MYSTKISAMLTEYKELIDFCHINGEVTFETYINDTYKKSLLLSAASYFEATITRAIHEFAVSASHNNTELVSFLDNKAICRQYHTLFNWESKNANQFFGLFGESLKNHAQECISSDKVLEEAMIAFIAIGRERNMLVHQNYVEAQINDTFEEIFTKYTKACTFVEFLITVLTPQ